MGAARIVADRTFEPTFPESIQQLRVGTGAGRVGADFSIDEEPVLAMMIGDYRIELIRRVMQSGPYLREGLKRARFAGGGGPEVARRPWTSPGVPCSWTTHSFSP